MKHQGYGWLRRSRLLRRLYSAGEEECRQAATAVGDAGDWGLRQLAGAMVPAGKGCLRLPHLAAEVLVSQGDRAIPRIVQVLESVLPRLPTPEYMRMLGQYPEDGLHNCMNALGLIGVAALPVLVEYAQSDNDLVRHEACRAIGVVGERAIPTLQDVANSALPSCREAAMQSFIALRERVVEALAALAKDSTDEDIRFRAVTSLGEILRQMRSSILVYLGRKFSPTVQEKEHAAYWNACDLAFAAFIQCVEANDQADEVRRAVFGALNEVSETEPLWEIVQHSGISHVRANAMATINKIDLRSLIYEPDHDYEEMLRERVAQAERGEWPIKRIA